MWLGQVAAPMNMRMSGLAAFSSSQARRTAPVPPGVWTPNISWPTASPKMIGFNRSRKPMSPSGPRYDLVVWVFSRICSAAFTASSTGVAPASLRNTPTPRSIFSARGSRRYMPISDSRESGA